MIQIAQLCSIISLRPHISVINVSTPSGVRGSQYRVAMENVHPSKTVYSNCKNLHFFVGGRFPKFKYQNLKLGCEIHSQEWWVPWGWKKSRRIKLSWKTVHKRHKNGQIGTAICPGPRGSCKNFCSFTIVVVGGTFVKVITQIYRKGENCFIFGSVSFFVRGL